MNDVKNFTAVSSKVTLGVSEKVKYIVQKQAMRIGISNLNLPVWPAELRLMVRPILRRVTARLTEYSPY